jgi:hypothetical protein
MIMRKLIILTLALAVVACDDFFEKDLSDDKVQVVAPVDGATAPEGEITFAWRAMDGARSYRVTVVSPSFAEASTLAADTLMHNDSLSMKLSLRLQLAAGSYQWSISARNSAYTTPEQVYTLSVAAPPEEPEDYEHPEEPEP